MTRIFVTVFLGCAFLLAPFAAAAQDYTPRIRSSTFVPIDPKGPGIVTIYNLSSAASVTNVPLPFPVVFYGDLFLAVNISRYGYVTFSGRQGTDEASSSGLSYPGQSTNQYPLPDSTAPNGVIAAWWDSGLNQADGVKTWDAVIQGSRTFTIEWNGFYGSITYPNDTAQMQIRFTENSPVISVHYGTLGSRNHLWSATVGIENPPRWRRESDGTWTQLAPGGTIGVSPLGAACAASCPATAWPTNQVIQYGSHYAPDLQAGANPNTGKFGLQLLSLAGSGTITAEIQNNIENGGSSPANSVTWEYYLSDDEVLDPATDRSLPCSHTTPEDIPGLAVRTFTDTCTIPIPAGIYSICTRLDPPSESSPEGAIIEAIEDNNGYCSTAFAVGADISGSLKVPAAAEAGGTMKVPVVVENHGTDSTGEFEVQIRLRDCDDVEGGQEVLAWKTTISLQDAGPAGTWNDEVEVTVRPDVLGRSICALLVIDPHNAVEELNKHNNTYSTCVANDESPRACVQVARPDLQIDRLIGPDPDGCFFGEPSGLTARLCNRGLTAARDFGLAFFLDVNDTISFFDTLIASVPQACNSASECTDLGGGPPACIDGICHAPCLADADCGGSGLGCEPSFVTEGKTCQLVLERERCRDVSINVGLPTLNERLDAPFVDGGVRFSAILDWTEAVAELVEGSENTMITPPISCRTRKPDFAPVKIRAPSTLGSGEVAPVAWRVRNLGPASHAYTYRFFLSSNDSISVHDLALEIVGAGLASDSFVDAWGDDTGEDLVRLPDGIPPGTYYLGILADPDKEILELQEDNNSAHAGELTVVNSSLRVATERLRTATVDATYAVQLLAIGGGGAYTWSVTSGNLPPGVRLDTNGLLHGTPRVQGVYLFEVTVASGPKTASTPLVLEASPARDPLTITLAELPPAFRGTAYGVPLGASGGLPPYSWDCPTKPDWLTLEDNFLGGTSVVAADPVPVVCSVTDANGTRISKNYSIVVYSTARVRIRSTELPVAEVGIEMPRACLAAVGGSDSYHWSIDTASMPPGLVFESLENAGCFKGTPVACGIFLIGVTVADAGSGLTDTRRLALTVFCDDLRLTTRSLPIAERGVEYPATQLATNSGNPVVFEIASGELPPGLTLSAEGSISGKVTVDAQPRAHNLAVRFRDEFGRSGIDAVAIQVDPDPRPDVTLTRTTTGCSASGEGWAASLLPLAAVLALFGLLRRKPARPAVAGVAMATLLFPAVAAAQSTPGYATHHRPKPYEKLETALPLDFAQSNAAILVTLPVPFRFFEVDHEKLFASENGLLLFNTTNYSTTTPYTIPPMISTATPRNFIAGWWDDHILANRPNSFLYTIRGEEPNRELVFEWNWRAGHISADPLDGGEHQISLFENGDIAIRWGKIVDTGQNADTHAAVIGLTDATGSPRSVPFLPCSSYFVSAVASCRSTDWNGYLANTEAVFTTRPNLRVLATTTTRLEGLSGIEQTFEASVYNHGAYSTRAPVGFFVSTDATFSTDDVPIGISDAITVGSFATARATLTAPLPMGLTSGQRYLLAVADPDDAVYEFDDDDNVGSIRFFVVPARPDLEIVGFGVPASGARGSNVTVDLTIRNLGNLDATDVPFSVVLSDNEAITASDFPIFKGTVSVGWLQTVKMSVGATIPTNTPPGAYWMGVVLDPEGAVPELDELNNAAIADRSFVVTVDGIVVTTLAPTSIQVGSEFCISLGAEGGDGIYTWALVEGTLPPGLELVSGSVGASICGRTTAVGIYDFALEVRSAGLTTRTQMTLEVEDNAFDLSIGARELPIAEIQVPYEAGLLAFGGTVPYTWELVGGTLPAGLSILPDGLVFGAPQQAGTFLLDVKVTDAANRTATETVALPVAQPSRLTCTSRTLGTPTLGEYLAGKLFAAGGDGENRWMTIGTVRYGDPGALDLVPTDPPPGLDLDVTTGEVTGTPLQVGRFLWTVEVASGLETDTCAITVDVVGGPGLTVTTTALPVAVPEKEYRAQLKAIGGEGTIRWSLVSGSFLPGDLTLDSTGLLVGTPTVAALQDQKSRTFGFRVEVRDARNLKGTGNLSVTLALDTDATKEVIEREEGGCQAARGSFDLAALALALVALRRRR